MPDVDKDRTFLGVCIAASGPVYVLHDDETRPECGHDLGIGARQIGPHPLLPGSCRGEILTRRAAGNEIGYTAAKAADSSDRADDVRQVPKEGRMIAQVPAVRLDRCRPGLDRRRNVDACLFQTSSQSAKAGENVNTPKS